MEKKNSHNKGEKKLLDPEKNIINVSLRFPSRKYILIGKLILKKFRNLELHSLGRASENVVKVAEALKRGGFAKIDKIESYITSISDERSNTGTRAELAFRVILSTGDNFDELTKDLILK